MLSHQVLPPDARYGRGLSEYRRPVGMPAEQEGSMQFEYQVVRRILDPGNLLEHHLTFQFEVGFVESRVEAEVRQHIYGRFESTLGNPGEKGRMLVRGVGVERSAQAFDREGQLPG